MWDFIVKAWRYNTEDLNLSVLERFFPRNWAYLPLSGRGICKVILCQVKDAKSPVHCQDMHSSLPLLHPKISQSSIESPLVLKTQGANCDPIHCFGWSIMTITWQVVLLRGLVHSAAWSRRLLISDERNRAEMFRNIADIVFEGESNKSDSGHFSLSATCQIQPENSKTK